jgi:hypothetical protein
MLKHERGGGQAYFIDMSITTILLRHRITMALLLRMGLSSAVFDNDDQSTERRSI